MLNFSSLDAFFNSSSDKYNFQHNKRSTRERELFPATIKQSSTRLCSFYLQCWLLSRYVTSFEVLWIKKKGSARRISTGVRTHEEDLIRSGIKKLKKFSTTLSMAEGKKVFLRESTSCHITCFALISPFCNAKFSMRFSPSRKVQTNLFISSLPLLMKFSFTLICLSSSTKRNFVFKFFFFSKERSNLKTSLL